MVTTEWQFAYITNDDSDWGDFIGKKLCCNHGWTINFKVFSETPEADNTFALVNYQSSNPGLSSNVFLANEPFPSDIKEPFNGLIKMFIPGKSGGVK